MLHQYRHDRLRGYVVLGFESQFFEHRVLSNEVSHWVFEDGHDALQHLGIGFGLDVLDNVELDAQLSRNGESIGAGVSSGVVKDRHIGSGHGSDTTVSA